MKILVNVPIELTIEEGKNKLTEALRILNNIDSEVVSFEWDSQPNLRTDLIFEHDIIEVTEEEETEEQETKPLSIDEIKKAINSIFNKIMENGCEAWEDNMEETKTVIPVEEFRGVKYTGWLQELTELKNKL